MTVPPTTRLFISYSRKDSELVDRLAADLSARGFHPWVDRERLEGGVNWRRDIQRAIETSDCFLLILTPNTIKSQFVEIEYNHASLVKKPIIPLICGELTTKDLRLGWGDHQAINMQGNYERGLQQLQAALLHVAPPQSTASVQIASSRRRDLLGLLGRKAPKPAPPPKEHLPIEELHDLYVAGAEALETGDLERAAAYWNRILQSDNPDYLDNLVRQRMQELNRDLLTSRKQHLRESAEGARVEGDWRGEYAVLDALSQLERLDAGLQARKALADKNRKHQDLYNIALDFVAKGNRAEAQRALKYLWGKAPDYGDPRGIAPGLDMKTPQQEAEEKEERERIEREKQLKKLQDEETERYEIAMSKWEKDKADWETRVETIPGFVELVLMSSPPVIWMALLFLSSGVGSVIGFATHTWVVGALSAAVLSIIAFAIGYNRAIQFPVLLVLTLISAALVFGTVYTVDLWPLSPHQAFSFFSLGPIGTLANHGVIFLVLYTLIWTLVGSATGGIGGLLEEDFLAGLFVGALSGLVASLVVAVVILIVSWSAGALLAGLILVLIGWILLRSLYYEDEVTPIAVVTGIFALISLSIPSLVLGLDTSSTVDWALGLAVGIAIGIGVVYLVRTTIEAHKPHPYKVPAPMLRQVTLPPIPRQKRRR